MSGDLYEMLGLPTGTASEQLRARYEEAIAAANQWKDIPRVRELSQAFDRLPVAVRMAVYPGRENNASRIEGRPATNTSSRGVTPKRVAPMASRRAPKPPGKRAARRAERKARARAAYQHTGMRKPFRIAFYALGSLMVGLVAVQALQHYGVIEDKTPTQRPVQNVPAARPTVVVAAPYSGHVAPSYPVGSDGKIVVVCQKEAFGAGTVSRVTPGTYVECADGATPYFTSGN